MVPRPFVQVLRIINRTGKIRDCLPIGVRMALLLRTDCLQIYTLLVHIQKLVGYRHHHYHCHCQYGRWISHLSNCTLYSALAEDMAKSEAWLSTSEL
jgi:hypothetical protein